MAVPREYCNTGTTAQGMYVPISVTPYNLTLVSIVRVELLSILDS